MPTIKMLKTLSAYDNLTGERAMSLYEEGSTYEVSESLCADLIGDGAAEEADDAAKPETRETKVAEAKETKPMPGRKKRAFA